MSKDSASLCISIKITIFIEFSKPLLVQMSMQNEITIYDKYSYELKKIAQSFTLTVQTI